MVVGMTITTYTWQPPAGAKGTICHGLWKTLDAGAPADHHSGSIILDNSLFWTRYLEGIAAASDTERREGHDATRLLVALDQYGSVGDVTIEPAEIVEAPGRGTLHNWTAAASPERTIGSPLWDALERGLASQGHLDRAIQPNPNEIIVDSGPYWVRYLEGLAAAWDIVGADIALPGVAGLLYGMKDLESQELITITRRTA